MRSVLATQLFLLLLAAPAAAEQLQFIPHAQLTVPGFSHNAFGDVAYDRAANRVWVCNTAPGGQVYEINILDGSVLSQYSPASIPGLTLGPDALAFAAGSTTPDMFVLSSFLESAGGRVTQAGSLIANFGTSHNATGADVDNTGNLWIATGTVAGGGSILRRIDPTTGVILQSVPILANTARVVDLVFDPETNACYCLMEGTNVLIEVNLSTGAQVSQTDLTPLLPGTIGINGGIDCDRFGQFFYVAGYDANHITVLRRDFERTICDGTGSTTACPCGNAGQLGRGCDNSFATGGARLFSTGIPSVGFDSLILRGDGMPPTTSCLFFQGTTTPESAPTVFGDGLRCVSGAVIRLGTKATAGGVAQYPVAGDVAVSVRGAIPAVGATRFYQVWYRNIAPFCTPEGFNLSSAVKIRWQL